MDKSQFIEIIKPNYKFIVSCCVISTIILLAGIWPYQRYIADQNNEINLLQYQIKEQEALSPVLKTLIESGDVSGNELLMIEQEQSDGIIPKDTSTISEMFKKFARKAGLSIISLAPELNSLTKDSKYLPFEMQLHGDLIGLRNFLVSIGRIHCLEHIETIDIYSRGRMKEYYLKIWTAYK
jgi:hypothetical protein